MRKRLVILLTALAALPLIACGGGAGPTEEAAGSTQSEPPVQTTTRSEAEAEMYLEPARLTQEEQAIADLLSGTDGRTLLCDFSLDDTVQTAEATVYELADGQWQQAGAVAWEISGTLTGRMALQFENILVDGFAISMANGGSYGYHRQTLTDTEGLAWTTSNLSQRTQIVYDQEVPVTMQVLGPGGVIRSYPVETFFLPAEIEPPEEGSVYALTIRFSQETMEELYPPED